MKLRVLEPDLLVPCSASGGLAAPDSRAKIAEGLFES